MVGKMVRQETETRYRGLPVTVVGHLQEGLIAVAGLGTASEVALAAIRLAPGGETFCVDGAPEPVDTLEAAAALAAELREAKGQQAGASADG